MSLSDQSPLPSEKVLVAGPESQEDRSPPPLSRTRLFLIASAPCVVWWAGVMNICGMGFFLPLMQKELHSSDGEVQWTVSSFNITWGCFALIAGRISDIVGLKKAYMFGLLWYSVWNLACAFMPNVAGVSVARGLAGVGFAIGTPCGSGLVGTYIPAGRGRTLAFVIMAGAGAVGAGMGWALNGVMTEARFTWRINPVVTSLVNLYPIIITWLVVPKDKPHPHDKRIDWLGAFAITAAQLVLMLALTLSVSDAKRWQAPYIPPLMVGAAVLSALFVAWQVFLNRRAGQGRLPPPLIPRRLFLKSRGQLIPLYISAIFVWINVDNVTVTAVYFYRYVLDIPGKDAGLRASVSVFAGVKASVFVGFFMTRLPARLLLVIVDGINAVSGIIFGSRGLHTPYWKADLWAWIVIGWASDGTTAVGSTLISECTEAGDQAVANALLISFSRFGAALGLALVTIIRESIRDQKLRHAGMEQLQATWKGIQAAFYFTAASGFMAVVIIAFFMRGWHVIGRETRSEEPESDTLPTLKSESHPTETGK